MANVNEESKEQSNASSWNLDNLPIEILLHICSFLDSKFIVSTLSLVCEALHDIFEDHISWKIRTLKRWPNKYPPIPVNDDEFPWKEAAIQKEEQWSLWTNIEEQMMYVDWPNLHSSSIDAVHILNGSRVVVAGSRDRTMNVLDIASIYEHGTSDMPTVLQHSIRNAHKGWIWDIKSTGSLVFSASWDAFVKIWDAAKDFTVVTSLSLAVQNNLVAVGTYRHKVLLFDPRDNYSSHCWCIKHKGPVLSLVMDAQHIISASEDGSCQVWDLRMMAGKTLNTIWNMLYMGDIRGRLHLVDGTQGKFELCQDNVLAAGCTDALRLWLPRQSFTCE